MNTCNKSATCGQKSRAAQPGPGLPFFASTLNINNLSVGVRTNGLPVFGVSVFYSSGEATIRVILKRQCPADLGTNTENGMMNAMIAHIQVFLSIRVFPPWNDSNLNRLVFDSAGSISEQMLSIVVGLVLGMQHMGGEFPGLILWLISSHYLTSLNCFDMFLQQL
jgi:hypothetical protein